MNIIPPNLTPGQCEDARQILDCLLDPDGDGERSALRAVGELDEAILAPLAAMVCRAFRQAGRDGLSTGRQEAKHAIERLIDEVEGGGRR